MIQGRQAFGICCIGNQIYALGGISNEDALDSVEVYDVSSDKWEQMEQKLPKKAYSMSLVAIQKRYIFSFG